MMLTKMRIGRVFTAFRWEVALFLAPIEDRTRGKNCAMKTKKVLIIDDEKDFGVLMKSFFMPTKYEVFIAYTIAEGMKILDEIKPDLIFLDNNLPDGLGWGKTEFILMNYPQTQLNLISALDVPVTSASGFRILHKPLLREELIKICK